MKPDMKPRTSSLDAEETELPLTQSKKSKLHQRQSNGPFFIVCFYYIKENDGVPVKIVIFALLITRSV